MQLGKDTLIGLIFFLSKRFLMQTAFFFFFAIFALWGQKAAAQTIVRRHNCQYVGVEEGMFSYQQAPTRHVGKWHGTRQRDKCSYRPLASVPLSLFIRDRPYSLLPAPGKTLPLSGLYVCLLAKVGWCLLNRWLTCAPSYIRLLPSSAFFSWVSKKYVPKEKAPRCTVH